MQTKTNNTLKIEIANCDPQLNYFLRAFVGLMTDPAFEAIANHIRTRRYVITMDENGTPLFEDQDGLGGFKNIVPPPSLVSPELHDWKKITDFTGIGEGWTHRCSKCGSVTDYAGVKAIRDGCEPKRKGGAS
jgi:hypothetical protein